MKIELKSKELAKNITDTRKVNEEKGEVMKKLIALTVEDKKLQHKVTRLKEKGVKILDKVLQEQYEMDEFDYTGQMEVKDKETVEADLYNMFSDVFKDPEIIKNKLREDKTNREGAYADPLMLTGHKNKPEPIKEDN